MQNQQIVDYIGQHLGEGDSEQGIREHLLRQGCTDQAVDEAFAQVHSLQTASAAPSASAAPPATEQSVHNNAASGKKLRRSRVLKLAIGLVVLLVVIVVIGVIVLEAPSPSGPSLIDKAAQPALKQHYSNADRQNDAGGILGAVQNFMAAHKNALPTTAATGATASTLDLCGTDCSAANKVSVKLYAYKPTAVSFKTYAAGLTVPDANTVYLVAHATCKSSDSGIGAPTRTSSLVALFAIESGKNIQQQCFGL